MRPKIPLLVVVSLLAAGCVGSGQSSTSSGKPQGGKTRPATALQRKVVVRGSGRLQRGLQGVAAASTDRAVYVSGGLAAGDQSVNSVQRIGGDGSVSQIGTLPEAVHDAAAAIDGGRVIVFGGGSTTTTNAITATPMSGGQGRTIGYLPMPLSDLTAATGGGDTYLVGGYDGTAYSDRIMTFENGRVRTVGRLPTGLRYVAAAVVGHYLLIAGGLSTRGATSMIFRFDPSSGSVSKIGSLPYPLTHASAGAMGSKMFVVGGKRNDTTPTDSILSITSRGRVKIVAHLPLALSDAGVVTTKDGLTVVGGTDGSNELSAVLRITSITKRVPTPKPTMTSASGKASAPLGFRGPLPGDLMIADRGNDRILIVDPQHKILWRFPKAGSHVHLHFDDDTFFADGGKRIISNEEENQDIIQIAYPSGKLLWRFGHPGVSGASFGYLHTPDDAYRLDNGLVIVADAYNCRVLEIRGHRVIRSIGQAGHCVHDPPRYLQPVNGDTPLPNGHILVSELNTPYIDEFTLRGRLVRTYQPHVAYPSDPQPTRSGNIILADYVTPGGVVIISRKTGRVVWQYRVPSGHGELDHPSLAAMLPNGNVIVGDDYNHRIVIIDRKTKKIVWHYGHDHVPGRSAGYLNIPDGFDFVPVTPGGKPNPAAIHHGP